MPAQCSRRCASKVFQMRLRALKSNANPSSALLVFLQLRLGESVLALQVLGDALAFRRQLRVQFERLEVDVGLHLAVEALQCLIQRRQPDGAPRADHVGNEIDAQRGHGHFLGRECTACHAAGRRSSLPPILAASTGDHADMRH